MWSTIRHYALAVRSSLGKLHGDQTGAEGLEKLLIVGAIVLPLLLVLIVFRDQLFEWVTEKWDDILGGDDPIP
jgi:hypothetical protein